jgi:transcriptional regulator with GAF, ATPase, and Fis domain
MTKSDDRTEPLASDTRDRPPPIAAILRVTDASATPASFRLTSGKCRIGSGAECEIVVKDPTVSKVHVELELVPSGVRVHDLGSTNGTHYLEHRIGEAVLALGARLRIGNATLAIDADSASLDEEEYTQNEYHGAHGISAPMRKLFAKLRRLEGSLVTVLLEGESGVGKEVIATAIHRASSRAIQPFVELNCGAIPRELIGSELFGHKRGAFTGAVQARRGAFDSADGGTLFLDEIGELPLDLQPVLLRALESGEIRPLGSDEPHRVDVRVLAATNRRLEDDVEAGRFRADLFFRLAVVRLEIPPLRTRTEDIELLARAFAKQQRQAELPRDVIERLRSHSWPGNARELKNAVLAYGALGVLPEPTRAKGSMLGLALSEFVDVRVPYAEQKDELQDRFMRAYLEQLMAYTNGNQTAAARISGLDRSYIGRLLTKFGMTPRRF